MSDGRSFPNDPFDERASPGGFVGLMPAQPLPRIQSGVRAAVPYPLRAAFERAARAGPRAPRSRARCMASTKHRKDIT